MTDLNNNTPKFNLPSYLNIPFFLYQDARLDKPDLLIASFLYSLHTSGKKLTASSDYLCQLANIKKRQFYNIMNALEDYKYIKRSGFTNRKQLNWIYSPESSITIVELDTTALQCTSDKELNTSALQCSKLVHSSALNYCTPVHTDNKEDIKEDIKNNIPASSKTGSKKVIRDYEKDERFLRFYSAYPKKEDPRDAWKAFKSVIGGNDELLEQVIEDIELRKSKHSKWQDRQYIKYPAVYLRKGEYLGEIFNAQDEAVVKNEKVQQESKERLEKQEEASKLRAENDRKNEEIKQSDAVSYRNTIKQSPSQTTKNALNGLREHLRG